MMMNKLPGVAMMLTKSTHFLILPLLLGMAVFQQSLAFDPLPGRVFQAACKEYEKNPQAGDSATSADLCSAFLLGYISAARHFYLNTDEKEDFHQRAMETRAKGLLYRDNRLKGKRFCVPASEPLENIISKINDIKLEDTRTESAENVVEIVLDAYYTCSE